MSKKPKLTSEERELFRKTMQNVSPIEKSNKVSHQQTKISPKISSPQARKNTYDEPLLELFHFSDPNPNNLSLLPEQTVSYKQPGLQTKTFNQLKKGQLEIEARLDLHYQTIDQARESLAKFLNYVQKRQFRVILIVHGKGLSQPKQLPKLKNYVSHWLAQYKNILAFCSAKLNDGGAGALYVLLAKNPIV